jgi:hypothetical protein
MSRIASAIPRLPSALLAARREAHRDAVHGSPCAGTRTLRVARGTGVPRRRAGGLTASHANAAQRPQCRATPPNSAANGVKLSLPYPAWNTANAITENAADRRWSSDR